MQQGYKFLSSLHSVCLYPLQTKIPFIHLMHQLAELAFVSSLHPGMRKRNEHHIPPTHTLKCALTNVYVIMWLLRIERMGK